MNMKRYFALFIMMNLSSCAFQPGRSNREDRGSFDSRVSFYIEPEAKGLFSEAEQDTKMRKNGQAIAKFDIVRKRWPSSKAAEVSSFRIASLYYSMRDYVRASKEFQSFLKRYSVSSFDFDARYHLAASQYQLGQNIQAGETLRALGRDQILRQGQKRALTYYQLRAINAQAQGDHVEAILSYSYQAPLLEGLAEKSNVQEKIESLIKKINDPQKLQQLTAEAADLGTRKLAAHYLAQMAGSSQDLSFQTKTPKALPLDLGQGSEGSKLNVGVILPLKGKLAPYGRKALEGIIFAADMFTNSRGDKINLFVEDSGSSPWMASRAVEFLVKQRNVMAILGPLNSKEAQAVAEKAQELGVVNISLSSKTGLSQEGPYVFQNAITPEIQLANLVRFVVREKGIRRLAILGPSSSFGRDMADAFWDLVESHGGTIRGVEFYPPGATDFQDSIKSLVGLKDVSLRKQEWTALRQFSDEQKKKTGRDPKAKLKPVIDFDAIFIPDSPKTVAAIAASLAYLDVNDIPLLGILEWNSDQLYRRGGQFVEKALFPGLMNPVTRSQGQKDFMRNYQQAFGSKADLLVAQSFESMKLISQGLQKISSNNRADLARAIKEIKNVDMPIGLTEFNQDRVAQRSIPLYSLDRQGNFIEQ